MRTRAELMIRVPGPTIVPLPIQRLRYLYLKVVVPTSNKRTSSLGFSRRTRARYLSL